MTLSLPLTKQEMFVLAPAERNSGYPRQQKARQTTDQRLCFTVPLSTATAGKVWNLENYNKRPEIF